MKHHYQASLQPQPGQKIWKYDGINVVLTEVQESDYQKQTAKMGEKLNKVLVIQPNFVYVIALNRRNAWKKVIAMVNPAGIKKIPSPSKS